MGINETGVTRTKAWVVKSLVDTASAGWQLVTGGRDTIPEVCQDGAAEKPPRHIWPGM